MTAQSVLFAKANLHEELMECAFELRTIFMATRNMLIKLANDTNNMSLERSDEQIAAIEERLPTALVECLHRHRGQPREAVTGKCLAGTI
jgi:hypothetical protein